MRHLVTIRTIGIPACRDPLIHAGTNPRDPLPAGSLRLEHRPIRESRSLTLAIAVPGDDTGRADDRLSPQSCGDEPTRSGGIDDDTRPQVSLVAVDQHLRRVAPDTVDAAGLKDNRVHLARLLEKALI